MYDAFRTTPDATSTDPTRRVVALDEAITRATTHERTLVTLQKTFRERLTALDATFADTRIETASARNERADLRTSLAQIERGVHPNEGATADLAPLAGMPGLPETRERIKELRAERAEWLHRRDHSHETKLYRLKPGMRHRVDGRLLLPGETVRLSWRGAQAFGDKFDGPVEEPVEEPAVTAQS